MSSTNKTVYFITGGGTGGHIYPAVAVADCLSKDENNKIFYIGNPKNLEFEIVKNYDFLPVNISGMPRKFSFKIFVWIIQLFFSILKSMYYILKYKPSVIFGTGGYVSAPCLIAGIILKIPFVMHDCDATPGLVTRKLSKYASSISLAFENAKRYLNNSNCYVNGNPIRLEFKTMTKDDARMNFGLENKLTLCIMGGSQGAKSINKATVEILEKLLNDYNLQVIFQTGKKKFKEVEEYLSEYYPQYKFNKNLIVRPYFNDMVSVLKSSDIAVSRAGSLSISELCACGIATIFVPYPYAASDHQRKNAKVMQEYGAGIYVEDDELTGEKLLNIIKSLTDDYSKMKSIQDNALTLARYDSVNNIVTQLKKVIK